MALIDPDGRQESAILKLTYELAKKSAQTVAPFLGFPLSPIAIIANFLFSPEEFGYAELRKFYIGDEGLLEYYGDVLGGEEINVFAESNVIDIPDEDKIAIDQLIAPKKRGDAPTSIETGESIEIHHVGQKKGGPYEERHRREHRTEGSYKKYHDTKKKSEREKNWSNIVKKYWQKEWDSGRFNK